MASNRDKKQERLRRRKERDRLRKQAETAEERETRSITLAIYICDVGLHSYIKTLLYRLARRREYDRCRHAAMTPEQQQQRERRHALNEQSGRNDQTGNDTLSKRRENYRLRQEMETDEERQSRLTASGFKIL